MNSLERCIRTLNHQEPDRIPMNYHADRSMSRQMKEHFGIQGDESRNCWLTGNEDPRLLEALGCDLRTLVPEYVGPDIPTHADGSFRGMFGENLLIQENPDGSAHFLYPNPPLANAKTVAEVDAHGWPQVEWFDFRSIPEQVDQYEGYAIIVGDMGTLDCMNRCLMLFGYERVMLGMAERDPAILRAFQHIDDFYYQYMSCLLDAARGKACIAYYGEDLGTQNGPRISAALYRDLIVPHWERHVRLVKKHGCFLMQHCCGSTRAFYPDLVRLGIDIHDTFQPEAHAMNPEEIKAQFGKVLSFHGGISIQQVLQTRGPEEVSAEVVRMIQALGRGGGYILAPTHWIQSGTPVENVLTMYEVAREYSAYFYAKT